MDDNNISEQFRVTGIIYGALIIGLITFFAIALFIVENKKFFQEKPPILWQH